MKKLSKMFNILLPFLFVFAVSCTGTRNAGNADNLVGLNDIKELVNNREFRIENEWALPLGGNSISLITNPNYIQFNGDSIDVFLPYFGVRRSGAGHRGEAGIKLKGAAEKLIIEEEKNGRNLLLRFEARDKSEIYQFFITVFPDRSAHTSVNSTERDAISYRGKIKPLPTSLRQK